MQDFDTSQYLEADRREVDPPVEVQVATWHPQVSSTGGSQSAANGSVEYAVQTVPTVDQGR
jgi:hypothetical protein